MAKKDRLGQIIIIALLLIPIGFLLEYLVSEAAGWINMNQYVLMAIVIIQAVQFIYFYDQSNSKLRKERGGEVSYQLHVTPYYRSMIISGLLFLFCTGNIIYATETFTMKASIGSFYLFVFLLGPCVYLFWQIINYRNDFLKVTREAFSYSRKGVIRKILLKEVEWVDYITKMMDFRRGDEKIGIVFKLTNGEEVELNTWKYGFTQKQVTELLSDISARMKGIN